MVCHPCLRSRPQRPPVTARPRILMEPTSWNQFPSFSKLPIHAHVSQDAQDTHFLDMCMSFVCASWYSQWWDCLLATLYPLLTGKSKIQFKNSLLMVMYDYARSSVRWCQQSYGPLYPKLLVGTWSAQDGNIRMNTGKEVLRSERDVCCHTFHMNCRRPQEHTTRHSIICCGSAAAVLGNLSNKANQWKKRGWKKWVSLYKLAFVQKRTNRIWHVGANDAVRLSSFSSNESIMDCHGG